MAFLQFDSLARVTPGASNATYTAGDVTFDGSTTTITMNEPGAQVINMTVSVHTSRTVYVVVNSVLMPLNNNVALTADALYTFVFIMHNKSSFSIQFSGATTINHLELVKSRS
jgi:hypothetical protein